MLMKRSTTQIMIHKIVIRDRNDYYYYIIFILSIPAADVIGYLNQKQSEKYKTIQYYVIMMSIYINTIFLLLLLFLASYLKLCYYNYHYF